MAIPANDMGEVSPEKMLHGMTLVLSRSAEQEAALQDLLRAQHDPASPRFQRWLTPEQFAANFGTAEEDLAVVQTWLQSKGFSIDGVGQGHDRISFSGNAGQIAAAFGTALHRYRTEDGTHFAPSGELSVPAALASMVTAVERLTDYRPKAPLHPQPAPEFTASGSQRHLLDPLDLETEYDISAATKAGLTGSGQAIAIVGQSWMLPSDLGGFQAVLLTGRNGNFSEVLVPNTGVSAAISGDEAEADLDVEYSSVLAPGADVYLVYVGDSENANVFTALSYAVEEGIAPIISISYGDCETNFSPAVLNSLVQITEQANAQGQTIVASAGDKGATTCYGDQGLSTAQQNAVSVDVPADLATVTGIGGLQLAPGTFSDGDTQFFAPSTGTDLYNSLLSYVPEVVWNEDSTGIGLVAGGGGPSTVIPRPAWQAGVPGIGAGSTRLVPDLALQASIVSPGFLYCTSDRSVFAPGQTSSCTLPGLPDELTGTYSIAGGTSFGAPVFAGMLALLNEAVHAQGLGNINPTLYSLAANSTTYASAFHDVTSGNNQCTAGVTVCASVGPSGFVAGAGYDQASGLGSIDFAKLVTAWPSTPASSLLASSVFALPSSFAPAAGSAQQLNITVQEQTPYSAVATGSVEVLLDGQVIATAVPLTPLNVFGSSATVNYTAPGSAGGHVLDVIYPGDSQHAPSSGTNVITIGSTQASGTFTLQAANLTLASNSSTSGTVTVTPAAGYSGVVNLSLTNLTTTSTTATSVQLCYGIDQVSTYAGAATATLYIGEGTTCSSSAAAAVKHMVRLQPQPGSQASTGKPQSKDWHAPAALATMLCGLPLLSRRSRRLSVVLVLLLAVAMTGVSGCGGSSGTASSPSPSPAPTTLVLTATLTGSDSVATGITASTTFTINLTQ